MGTSYLETYDKRKCTGCSACSNICACQAITMTEDSEGFLFPVINSERCTNCGLCQNICPVSNNDYRNRYDNQRSYLITTNEEKYYKESATIGICTMLAHRVIELGGDVFGVCLDEKDWKTRHICVNTKEKVELIRNSKYVQSDLNSSFHDAKVSLQKGKLVLYVGTPCQIAGLKAFLGKEYEKLLTIDLICHGVYSYKLIQKEIDYWEKKLKGEIFNFKFRSKKEHPWTKGGIINFDLRKRFGTKHYEIPGPFSPTYRCFAYHGDGNVYNLRESCYSCPFREKERYGDLTVGDAWFIDHEKYHPFNNENYENGISLVISNSDKGQSSLDEVVGLLNNVIEIPNKDAFVQPALLPANRDIPTKRYLIYDNLEHEDYGELISRLLKFNFEQQYYSKMPNSLKDGSKAILKKILLINKYRQLKATYKPGFEWWFTNSFLYNFPSKRFRNMCLRKMGMKMDKDVRLYAGFHIREPRGITIEKGVSIGPKVLLDGRRGLTIKESAVIGYGAIIWTLNHDYNDINFCGKGAPVVIDKYAWVCSRSIILPGIHVGKGAVVASGAIVTKDVPPYAIVAGIPAVVVGQREIKDYNYGYNDKKSNEHFS